MFYRICTELMFDLLFEGPGGDPFLIDPREPPRDAKIEDYAYNIEKRIKVKVEYDYGIWDTFKSEGFEVTPVVTTH